MYDKVKLWIDSTMVGAQYPSIVDCLDKASEQTDCQTGEVKVFGYLGGLKVSAYASGLWVEGSLTKYLHGSNVYHLSRHETKEAIEKLSDALHLQVGGAKVTSAEFGTNFLMQHPVESYLPKLGNMPRLKRYHLAPTTLYYQGKGKKHPKVFAFYDKMAEAKYRGMDYPEDWEKANVLRYEMRLNNRLPYQLGVPEVTASTLYQESFYQRMVEYWQDSYFSITKQKQIKMDSMSEIKTVTDAYDVYVAKLITQTGQSQIDGFLDDLKAAGVFADRKNYTRLKKKLQDVSTKGSFTVSDELIRELDNEVRNCGAYD